jgi:hypothetical protein
MNYDQDHYEAYYGDKLWNLLPAIYRALDTDQFNTNGPLRELVNRIGAQAAILRRSLDRMWEDQSIEACDDWVIPYIGALLATNLVANLDSRGQRLDVAKTIYYRRRKGTLAILEEIAFDITGWSAKVVEFFRRLGRTRHGLDPAIVLPSLASSDDVQLQLAEGLIGQWTQTPIGGLANLRNVYGASKTGSAFDEFFHTADFRLGQGRVGWYDIPRLGVFLWRLHSYGVGPTTPVADSHCPGWYTFDPTGRGIPLFAAARTTESYGNNWVSPSEDQLPTEISQSLFDSQLAVSSPPSAASDSTLYPNSLAAFTSPDANTEPVPLDYLQVRPPSGRFHLAASPAHAVWVTYHYGFSSDIGAGPYDRRVGGAVPPAPAPEKKHHSGQVIQHIPRSGTFTLTDSLTYTHAPEVKVEGQLTIRADVEQRPVIRWELGSGAEASWKITGSGPNDNCLVLDGLFLSGADLVLAGHFDCVTINCCTLDPGSAAPASMPHGASPPSTPYAVAVDGRELVPSCLWVEATIGTLTIVRSITGPIRTRAGGQIDTLTITDSIIQAVTIPGEGSYSAGYSQSFLDPALNLLDGDVVLSRCTVLGPIAVHRLQASECILQDLAQVDDTQHGCIRFTAWTAGSILPRQFESVQIAPQASLFSNTNFGQPDYCQLLATVDAAILPMGGPAPAVPLTIAAGAENGSEMGAFNRELYAIKERGLLIKYKEYMPAGLAPVLIYVT